MLSPERIEGVGRASGEIAAELQETLLRLVMANVRAALERGGMGPDALFKLSLDVQQQALREVARRNPEMVAEAAGDVTLALAESLDDDLSRIGTTLAELPPHVAADMHRSAATTAQGVAEIVRRDNLSMADDARRQFLDVTSTHVSLVNAGQLTFEEAVRAACRELGRVGVACVDYASGQRADLDVAIRRHVRSQVNQAGNRRTMQLMEECSVGFVEVSSHVGARPSHRAWQGRCYSLSGRQVVDGEVYEDFWEETGYQGRNGAKLGDQLCGVNCRHSFGPYLPGEPRTYSPTPDEDAGLDPDEAYAATQRQRELERRVRRARRKAEAAEAAGDDASAERAAVRKAQRDVREHVARHEHLGRDYGRERLNVYDRTVRAVTSQCLTEETYAMAARMGIPRDVARGAISDRVSSLLDGVREFARATAEEVREIVTSALSPIVHARWESNRMHSSLAELPVRRSARSIRFDVTRTNPNYGGFSGAWDNNCVGCVTAYEARRRGYEVTAGPYSGDGDFFQGNWSAPFQNPRIIDIDPTSQDQMTDVSSLMSGWGDGSRAIVSVGWRGKNGDGHVFIAEQVGGVTMFVDPQTGDMDVSGYFADVDPNDVQVMRVDDLDFDPCAIDCMD